MSVAAAPGGSSFGLFGAGRSGDPSILLGKSAGLTRLVASDILPHLWKSQQDIRNQKGSLP
jgi:hypothetical protein